MTGSLPAAYFDDWYAAGEDPWGFATRWYERRKYALTLASLPRERYRSAFEPGCSVGVLTSALAGRCDAVLAADLSDVPIAAARRRTAGLPHVRVERRAVPAEWPAGTFDLVVLGEVGYYLDPADLTTLLDRAVGALDPGGTLVAVHWRHPAPDYPADGDAVHAALAVRARDHLVRLVAHVEEDFLLDVYARPPAVSVARTEGLV